MSSNETMPVFIVGAERSGTTMFRLMLDHHPEITVIPEFEYVVDLLAERETWPSLEQFYSHLQSDRIFLDQKFTINPDLDYPALVNSFLIQQRIREEKQHVLSVVHRNFDQLKLIWPSARYIHIIRDPRDVARSCIHMGWAGNVWTGVERWIDAEKQWVKLKPELSASTYLDLKEEYLIEDPVKVLNDVCSFIGVPYDSQMLGYNLSTTYSKPDPSLIYQWKRKLTSKEVQLVESRTGGMLIESGYTPSGLPKIHPSFLHRIFLKVQDKISRLKYRLNYMGLKLFIFDFLSRRLHIKLWQDKLKPQLLEIGHKRVK